MPWKIIVSEKTGSWGVGGHIFWPGKPKIITDGNVAASLARHPVKGVTCIEVDEQGIPVIKEQPTEVKAEDVAASSVSAGQPGVAEPFVADTEPVTGALTTKDLEPKVDKGGRPIKSKLVKESLVKQAEKKAAQDKEVTDVSKK